MDPDITLPEPSPVFQQTYQSYLDQIRTTDLPARAARLGARETPGGLEIPFLGEPHEISPDQITDAAGDRPVFAVRLILLKYVLLCPPAVPRAGQWTPYHGFKDSGPLTAYFPNTIEKPLARHFAGRSAALQGACRHLDGRTPLEALPYDCCFRFEVLPRIPLLLAFNDRDEDFPAQCTLLFKASADQFLDPECLAILGSVLAQRLMAAD